MKPEQVSKDYVVDADLPYVQGRSERFGIKPDAGAHHDEEPKKRTDPSG